MDSYETNYDKIAETYLRHAGDKVSWNNLYERPYMLSIFDDFSTVDASQKMFDHVAESISSPKLKLYRSDLADGLSFVESESLDYMYAHLHYITWKIGKSSLQNFTGR